VARHFQVDAAALVEGSNLLDEPGLLTAGTEVACLSPTDPVAPRFSGQAVARRYVTRRGDGRAELLDYFGVALPTLAQAVADTAAGMPSLLLPGTVVAVGDHQHTIAEGDTLRSLLDPLHVDDVATLIEQIEVVSGTGCSGTGRRCRWAGWRASRRRTTRSRGWRGSSPRTRRRWPKPTAANPASCWPA
jgi:hypothetical protein